MQRDWGIQVSELGELSNISVYVAAVQETHFTCATDCRVLEDDYVVLSGYGNRSSFGVSLIIGRSLNAEVNLVLAYDGCRLVVADVAVKTFGFRVVAVYAPNITAGRVSFIRRLAPFLDDLKQIVLVGDWNVVLDPKIDRVKRELEGREGVKAASSILWLAMTWSIGFVWISQRGRCGCDLIVYPLPVLDLIWTEC